MSGRELVLHGGATGGYRADMGFDPAAGIGYVLLANSSSFGDDLGRDFLRRGPPLVLPEVTVPPARLAEVAGVYETDGGRTIVVRHEDGGVATLQIPGNVRFRLHATSDSTFFVKRAPWLARFTRGEDGRVVGLVLVVEGRERRARRTDLEPPSPAALAGNAAPAALPLPSGEAGRYVGAYTLRLGAQTIRVRVFTEDGQLMAQAEGQSATAMLYRGAHTFVLAADPGIRLSFEIEGGRAEHMILHQAGREVPGTRDPE